MKAWFRERDVINLTYLHNSLIMISSKYNICSPLFESVHPFIKANRIKYLSVIIKGCENKGETKMSLKILRYATSLPTITIVTGGEYLYNKFDFIKYYTVTFQTFHVVVVF
jgi:hypothetical protein